MAHRHQTNRDRAVVALSAALVVLIIAGRSFAQDRPATRPIRTEPKSCTAAGCHDTLTKPKYLHGPVAVNQCLPCHQETDRANHKYRMVADAPGLCFTCHRELQARLQNTTTRPHHHKPLNEGKCLDCHNPHASGHPMMLRIDSIVEMCMSCHKDKVSLAGRVHKPIEEKGCLECHRGHDSDYQKLLRAAPEDLCVQCHADTYQDSATLRSVHKPFADKECFGCHDPHASPWQKLLIEPFSADLYLPFNEESYGLCFSCHEEELAAEPVTTQDTKFRNGDRNLHYLHVNKKSKGRSCRICHLPHSSPLPRLIRPKVPFGQWEVTIRYTLTETGGFCGPGCHPSKRYDRLAPIDFSQEPVPPASELPGP